MFRMKNSIKKSLSIGVLGVIILLALCLFVLAEKQVNEEEDLGSLQIKSQGKEWQVIEKEKDFFIHIFDKNKHKTKVCELSKTAKKIKDLEDRDFSKSDNPKSISLTPQPKIKPQKVQAKDTGLKQDYYGYCYDIKDKEKKLKFGKASSVIVYQDVNILEYTTEWGAEANITLSCDGIPQSELFVYENPDSLKFGANGTFEGLKNCTYKLISANEIKDISPEAYIFRSEIIYRGTLFGKKRYEVVEYEKHHFSFDDVCNKNYSGIPANCSQTKYKDGNSYVLEINFTSNSSIDPTITVTKELAYSNGITNNTEADGSIHLSINTSLEPYDNLVLYYPFDGDSDTGSSMTNYDWTSGDHDATGAGTATTSTSGCLYHKCLELDGDSDYTGTNSLTGISGNAQGTISFWFKADSLGGEKMLMALYAKGTTQHIIRIQFQNSTHIQILNKDTSDNFRGYIPISNPTGKWHHFVLYGGLGGNGVYVDNVSQTVSYTSGSSGVNEWLDDLVEDRIDIGAHDLGAGYGSFWNGKIEEVMIFNKSLSQAEVSDIYSNQSARFVGEGTYEQVSFPIPSGMDVINVDIPNLHIFGNGDKINYSIAEWNLSAGYDETGSILAYWHFDEDDYNIEIIEDATGNYNGTPYNISVGTTDGRFYNAIKLNASNEEFVELNAGTDFDLTTDFSISVWFNSTATGGTILSNYEINPGTNPYYGWQFGIGSGILTSGKLGFEYQDALGGNNDDIETSTSYNDNKWHHAVIVIDVSEDDAFLYVDGVLSVSDTSFDLNNQVDYSGTDGEGITEYIGALTDYGGGSETPNDFYEGYMDELILWNKALSSTEVLDLYVKGRANWGEQSEYTNYSNNHTISTETIAIKPIWKLFSTTNFFHSPVISGDQNWTVGVPIVVIPVYGTLIVCDPKQINLYDECYLYFDCSIYGTC